MSRNSKNIKYTLQEIWNDVYDAASRFLSINLATRIAGENQTDDILKIRHQHTYQSVITADTQVKATPGFLHNIVITCNDAAPTAGSLIVYDNTAESGTQVFNHTFTTTPFTPVTVPINCEMETGIYVGFTTTADVNVTLSYD